MEFYLLIARSVTQAQHMTRVLEGCGIRSGLFRSPAGLTNRGCSYAVRIRSNQLDTARTCLSQAGLRPLAVFLSDNGAYREVVF